MAQEAQPDEQGVLYVIDLMGWLMGLEPTTTGITTRPPKITHK